MNIILICEPFSALGNHARPAFVVVDTHIPASIPCSSSNRSRNEAMTVGFLDFQKVNYDLLLLPPEDAQPLPRLQLARQAYPTRANRLEQFLDWRGIGAHENNVGLGKKESMDWVDTVEAALDKWGPNEYDIPIPQFLDLYLVSANPRSFVYRFTCFIYMCHFTLCKFLIILL